MYVHNTQKFVHWYSLYLVISKISPDSIHRTFDYSLVVNGPIMAVVWWVDVIEQITVARAIHFGTAAFESIIQDFINFGIFEKGTNRPRMFSSQLTEP